MRRIISYSLLTLILLTNIGCRDPFEIESIDFQDALVIEATITNELKKHIVKLSRTYELNLGDPIFVDDATVFVEDSAGNITNFASTGEGIYESEVEFSAIPDTDYQLLITTSQGERYESNAIQMTPVSELTNLYAELTTNASDEEGIQIYVDSDNQNGDANYFRYEYEETYQIIAPNWYPYKPIFTNYEVLINTYDFIVDYDVEFILRPEEERFCYTTEKQKGILLTSTSNLTENRVTKFPIRFINKNDGIIRDRYSIIVKQYVQSIEAYSYYSVIKDLGNVESILSPSQPGFVVGNITSADTPEKKVIGYFDVSSVTEKRIFFNYFDFGLTPPPYLYDCEVIELDYNDNSIADQDRNDRYEIYRLMTRFPEFNVGFELVDIPIPEPNGIWTLVNPECGDCTSISSNIRPDFWED